MPKTIYKAAGVVWDFDGTLLNSFGLLESVLTEVLQRRDMPVPPREVLVRNYHGRLIDSIKGICGAQGPLLQELYEDFIQAEEYHYQHPGDLFFEDAIDLLKRNHAAGLKQIIVSNRAHHNDKRLGSPRNLARRSPLKGLIERVVCGDDNDFHKPDARMLDAAERALGLERSEVLVIGDQFVDAELAHNLNTRAVLIARDIEDIPHLERLPNGWRKKVQIVTNLNEIIVRPQG